MRKLWQLIPLSAIVVVLVAAGPSDPFAGSWEATDTDGSNMSLNLGGAGDERTVLLFDDLATSPCPDPQPLALRGTGTVTDGSTLEAVLSGTCENGEEVGPFDVTFTYEDETNTLIDSLDIVWHRHSG